MALSASHRSGTPWLRPARGLALALLVGLARISMASEPSAFEAWLRDERQLETFREFTRYLSERAVADVVEPWTLLRQGTDWRQAQQPQFAIPPRAMWANVVATLEVLRDDIVPRIGPVEVVSGFRTRAYNERAGGATRSSHLSFRGFDVVPLKRRQRAELHAILERYWRSAAAKRRAVGLGFYRNDAGRFHIDAGVRHRRWQ